MFFYTTYKSGLWKSLDKKSKVLRIATVGAVGYILLHSYIYSSYVAPYTTLVKYRSIIYYLIIFDILLSAYFIMFADKANKKKIHKIQNPMEQFMHAQQPFYAPTVVKKKIVNAKKKFAKPTQKPKKTTTKPVTTIPIYKSNKKKAVADHDIPIYVSKKKHNKPDQVKDDISVSIPIYKTCKAGTQ